MRRLRALRRDGLAPQAQRQLPLGARRTPLHLPPSSDRREEGLAVFVENGEGSGVKRSSLNTDMINMFDDAKAGKAGWKWATLWPGDCLFVPASLLPLPLPLFPPTSLV